MKMQIHKTLTLEERVKILQERHRSLNRAIDNNKRTRTFSEAQIAYMKRRKLKIKDKIAYLKRLMVPANT
jgi:hypothetical protein